MKARKGFLLLLLMACFAGCGRSPASSQSTRVFAAASLTASFEELARRFEAEHVGSRIELHFAGTPTLVLQIREGAGADVFASADMPNMQKVVDAKATAGSPLAFASNRLTIVVAKGNPKHVAGLPDLARADLKVALCGPEVPAGKYARQALAKANVEVRSVSDEASVKALASKVELGEVDAGIVYVTDAASAKARLDAVPIPESQNLVATYPIAMLANSRAPAAAAQFVEYVRSPAGQAVLAQFGFGAP
jgi:molybdate transport system substrate-binding protein